jgi:hypothetical protein
MMRIAAVFAARAVWRWTDRIDFHLPDWRRRPRTYPYPGDLRSFPDLAGVFAATGVTAAEVAANAAGGIRMLGEIVQGVKLTDLEAARLLGQLDGDDD